MRRSFLIPFPPVFLHIMSHKLHKATYYKYEKGSLKTKNKIRTPNIFVISPGTEQSRLKLQILFHHPNRNTSSTDMDPKCPSPSGIRIFIKGHGYNIMSTSRA